ncbi:hypothetical protein SAMN02745181_3473 [Rubritalea squalenifaciens DSM 18772]|uniref:DUF2199 domain-containing protein n=1 Tax=Rubritalea squalenifaciens DSM 18772 TaxID=1123071 RepID=A0A1M6QQT2_9BACT|nr:DUF2199 domain-containing protein [Rubritalea squalenifaciens]SHK22387.1 hypothetical protein SAMN02745181_3473 [Rubritalea squalenifaciens DSM 18772]
MWFKHQKCPDCGKRHPDVPLSFGSNCPWEDYAPAEEFDDLVDLTDDLCVIGDEIFLIRGHIELPIHGQDEPFIFSVWSSLSEQSFAHVTARWNETKRAQDPPYFGWLCTSIPIYPETMHLKLSVQSCAPGLTPLFTVEPTDHPLAIDQHLGISVKRWHKIASQLLKQK